MKETAKVLQIDSSVLTSVASLQVIFLDSDNVPVADPAHLFDSQEYLNTGALLWPDYWQSSAAPDLAEILGVHHLPKGTFESGQMVFNKRRYDLAPRRPLTTAYIGNDWIVTIRPSIKKIPVPCLNTSIMRHDVTLKRNLIFAIDETLFLTVHLHIGSP
jgi:hypothetical protein